MKITAAQAYENLKIYFDLKPHLAYEMKKIEFDDIHNQIRYTGENPDLIKMIVPCELLTFEK